MVRILLQSARGRAARIARRCRLVDRASARPPHAAAV